MMLALRMLIGGVAALAFAIALIVGAIIVIYEQEHHQWVVPALIALLVFCVGASISVNHKESRVQRQEEEP